MYKEKQPTSVFRVKMLNTLTHPAMWTCTLQAAVVVKDHKLFRFH